MELLGNTSATLMMEPLLGAAQCFVDLPLHPVFNAVHFFLTAIALRNEPGGMQFAQVYPLASCVMTFLVAHSGGILANFMMGKPPIQCVLDAGVVTTCIVSWYLAFFSPLDICYGLSHFIPINILLWVIKELSRAKKVYNGVKLASTVYPTSSLAMAVVGMLKGSGKQWGITWYRLVFNPQTAAKHELLAISYVTKSAFILSLMLAFNHAYSIVDPAPLVLLSACVMVSVRLWNNQVQKIDPFLIPQGFAWQMLTCLSVSHPHREIRGVVGGGAMETRVRGNVEEDTAHRNMTKDNNEKEAEVQGSVEEDRVHNNKNENSTEEAPDPTHLKRD